MGSGVSKRPVEAPTGGELWSIMEGEAGWVSGMDSIPLNCLGIYCSHIGDSAEQVQMCDRLVCSDVLNRAWETGCM